MGRDRTPGGVVISSRPLIDMVPVQQSAIDGRYVCHWDKDSIDDAGFVKIDFLALGALSQMQEALQLIEERTGRYIDLSRIDFEDGAVCGALHRADTVGIFQVESAAQMQTIVRIKPRDLTEMVFEVAAVRPGVGANDGVTQFIRRHAGGAPWEFDHPLERRALERTLGVILFQDQVNQLAMDVAGFGAAEADWLRRAFGRKNNRPLIELYRNMFKKGAAERGVPQATAEKIFKKFNGQYMFPESHAFAFGVTAYHMAWLKYYYPLEFFVPIFNQQPMGFYNLETLKEDARRHGIAVLNPDINAGGEKCTIKDASLLLGFLNVKGVGDAAASAIVEARKRGGIHLPCRRHGPYGIAQGGPREPGDGGGLRRAGVGEGRVYHPRGRVRAHPSGSVAGNLRPAPAGAEGAGAEGAWSSLQARGHPQHRGQSCRAHRGAAESPQGEGLGLDPSP